MFHDFIIYENELQNLNEHDSEIYKIVLACWFMTFALFQGQRSRRVLGLDNEQFRDKTHALFVRGFTLLKTKRHLLYIRNQSVPRCKHFSFRL